jgi:hypothetical protein
MTRLFVCFVCLAFAYPTWSQAGTKSSVVPTYQGNMGTNGSGKYKNECIPGYDEEITSRYKAAHL